MRGEPALYELDSDPAGFEWIDCNDVARSVLTFLRKGTRPGDTLLFVCNFTPVPRHNYRVGAPEGGFWKEVLNSDAPLYGGSGQGNTALVQGRVIYELHVAPSDSNGDGIGDFPGLIEKLDYLQDLGVTCIWLLPFFPSPLRDDGYDIADYLNVNPMYGTMDDFKRLPGRRARARLQVMIELVINHTSDQHPWFSAPASAPPGIAARDFYVWSDTDQKYGGTRASSSPTPRNPTGPGIRWPRPTTGTASSRTSPT
jgi:1,4-alpha-glucan branching enzyme